jgi:putative FmdB family regulatory protein
MRGFLHRLNAFWRRHPMPIYEFKCLRCNHQFEFLCFRTDEKAECPACGSQETEKQLSTFSSVSSGSGGSGSIGAASSCIPRGGFS